jgi:peptidyl-prolyl cis-trans isomerase SurA
MKSHKYRILFVILSLGAIQTAMFSPTAGAVVLDRIQASVNSSLILLSDVHKFRETLALRAQLDPLFAGTQVAAQGSKASDTDIVEFLINEKLISQEFKVADTEVEQEINQIQVNNHIDRNTLKDTLKQQGFTFEEYFELIRTSTAKRNLIDRDIRSKVNISEQDIKNYYYNHYTKNSPAVLSYKVKIISISPGNYKTQAAAKDTAQHALEDLKKGEPFEDVAARVSDDASGKSGGDLGTLSEDQMSPLIRTNLKKLQIGETSDVISGPGGQLFILKLVDVLSSDSDRYNKMKDEIRNNLAAAEYQHQITLWLERQRQNSFVRKAGEDTLPSV